VDEEDLGLTMAIPTYRADYMTDFSYSKMLFVVAQYQIVAAGLSQQRSAVGYDTILKLDTGLQTEISRLELITDCSNPRLKPCESTGACLSFVSPLTWHAH
jgi:hypothetical protein